MNYLYGFTIYSIQGYIFQANKLKEIAGASELVEQICTTKFAEMIKKDFGGFKNDLCAIRNAAGNIRYLFDETLFELCKSVVREFPKKVLELAPGVQIGQAIVEISVTDSLPHKFEELEQKLTFQRNNPIRPIDLGYIAVNRSRRTGLPSCEGKDKDGKPLDKATSLKLAEKSLRVSELFFRHYLDPHRFTTNVEEIVGSKGNNYSWLAVIHADGNNMGQALKNLENEKIAQENYTHAAKKFSEAVDFATKASAQKAFYAICPLNDVEKIEIFPFRPIIVGGDDLTVVCRADLALDFTQTYLDEFKKQTEINFKKAGFTSDLKNGLTACAGIAYIKVNYPFHYAIDLAEMLCTHAKKDAKMKIKNNEQVSSCLMFHKVQDSFVEKYEDIIERELTAKASDIRFDYGPYYLKAKNGEPTIDKLLGHIQQFKGKDGNAIKSGLRQWLTLLHDDKKLAGQRMKRLISVANETNIKELGLRGSEGIIEEKSPVYDWLTILSINQNDSNNDDD